MEAPFESLWNLFETHPVTEEHPVLTHLVSWLFMLYQDRNVISCHMCHRPKQPSYLGEVTRTHLHRPLKLDLQIAAGWLYSQLTKSLLENSATFRGGFLGLSEYALPT